MKAKAFLFVVAVTAGAVAADAARLQEAPGGFPEFILIDPTATEARTIVLVSGTTVIAAQTIPGKQVEPGPPPPPDQPTPDVPKPTPAPSSMDKAVKDYVSAIGRYHASIGDDIQVGRFGTVADVGRAGLTMQAQAGKAFGAVVNDEVKRSGGFDASGKIVDRVKAGDVFKRVGASFRRVVGN